MENTKNTEISKIEKKTSKTDKSKVEKTDKEKKEKKEKAPEVVQPSDKDQPIKNDLTCLNHKQPITMYCENCDEPICQLCADIGPHNSRVHTVREIQQSKLARSKKLQELFNNELSQKKQQIIQTMQKFEFNLEELNCAKSEIEKSIRKEYHGILERLNSFDRTKTSVLRIELEDMNSDLKAMKKLYEQFTTLSGGNSIQFLLTSRKIYEEIVSLVEKPINENLELKAEDYPRELESRKDQENRLARYDEILTMKDEIIKKLILHTKEEVDKSKEKLEKSTKEEIQEWEKLTDKFAHQLQKFQLICSYCLVTLDDTTVNTECPKNHDPSEVPHRFTHDQPPKEFHGSRRHFFSKPIKELFEGDYKKATKMVVKKSPIQVFFEHQSDKIRQVCMESQTDLSSLLKSHDRDHSGLLNYIQFSYVLNEICKVGQDDIATMIKFLDQDGKKKINYNEFMSVLFDPDYFINHKDVPNVL